jgi:23S rRNA (guanosine2251-2'-O)-methyltransferase
MAKFIFGFHSIEAYIKTNPEKTEVLYVNMERRDKRQQNLLAIATAHNITIEESTLAKLDSLTAKTMNHQGVVAQIQALSQPSLDEFLASMRPLTTAIILILDGITDPQNLGAIIRTADCFGVNGIIIPKDNSANYDNKVVAKISSGAVNHVPIIEVNNLSRAMDKIKECDFWIAGTVLDEKAVSLFDFKPSNKTAWVLGSEGSGIRRLVKENCDYYVTIPLYGNTKKYN